MILPKHIVIVEDEVITQRYLQDILSQYDVEITGCFDNAKDTLQGLKTIEFEMILVDINIKGSTDGIQLTREILKHYSVPIIFITAHNDDATLEEVLELSPHGFIGKPFSSKDIAVTLQIAYKRYVMHQKASSNDMKVEVVGDVQINEKYKFSRELCELYRNGQVIKLNHKQSILLDILVKNINHTVRYDVLISEIWGEHDIADSTLRTLVYSIRKLEPELPIVSHSKVGYMIHAS